MSIWDQCQEMLSPHAAKLNQTIAATGMVIHSKLERIEQAISSSQKPAYGDHYIRFAIKRKFAAEETFELGECPINEIWQMQAIVADGVQNKAPAFIVFTDDEAKLFGSIIKEGLGSETIGGDMAVLPGETLFVKARTEGIVGVTIHLIRQKVPTIPRYRQAAAAPDMLESSNVHDPMRDVVAAATPQTYQEIPGSAKDEEVKASQIGEAGSQRATIRR